MTTESYLNLSSHLATYSSIDSYAFLGLHSLARKSTRLAQADAYSYFSVHLYE
jgi:hypothetical protein